MLIGELDDGRSKVKIFGKLSVDGGFEVEDAVEVWGAVVIQGYM